MHHTKVYGAASATSPLAATTIPRRDPTERDIQLEILFCDICHSISILFVTSGANSCPPCTRLFRA